MTSSTGAVVASYDYRTWGQREKRHGSMDCEFGFTGHWYDDFSRLRMAWFRAYDAQLRRWISGNSIGESGGVNLYGYVGNGSTAAIDLSGLEGHTILTYIKEAAAALATSIGLGAGIGALGGAIAGNTFCPEDRARGTTAGAIAGGTSGAVGALACEISQDFTPLGPLGDGISGWGSTHFAFVIGDALNPPGKIGETRRGARHIAAALTGTITMISPSKRVDAVAIGLGTGFIGGLLDWGGGWSTQHLNDGNSR